MDILSDDEYMKLIKMLSSYDIRVVEDKIYGLPKYSVYVINELYIQGTPEGYDICDLILFYNYYTKTDQTDKRTYIKNYLIL